MVFGLSTGQVGVAVFLAISGFLAVDTRRPPIDWLRQRLIRVYPPFWIALALGFTLAWMTAVKSFDAWQVFAQFSGIALFTHLDNLIDAPTWFVSLLLVCYLGTFAARFVGYPFFLGASTALIMLVLVATTKRTWLLSHLLTYSLAYTITLLQPAQKRQYVMWGSIGLTMLLTLVQPEFGFTWFALLVVEASLHLERVPRLITWMAEYSYEFYLIHWLFLNGFIRYLPSTPVLAVVLAIGVSAVGSVMLHHLVKRLTASHGWDRRHQA